LYSKVFDDSWALTASRPVERSAVFRRKRRYCAELWGIVREDAAISLRGLLEEGRHMRLQCVVSVVLALVLVAGFSLGSQAPMPLGSDLPIELIRVKQVSQLLSDGAPVLLVDVRSRQDYLIRHIKGAVSIPIDSIEMRSREIPRDGIVVLY
jgi:hypothetical protein